MIEKTVTVLRKSGLQARPAALFVQEANRFTSDIFIEKDGKNVNAKSIMGIMSIAVGVNKDIHIKVDGPDEQVAMDTLIEFVEKKE
ncbi:phosphocarrier protein Chr [Salipaludibacillus neizhouensis]|uniref:Phosphocarrier protein Chr n=1 Tax=Salipaludibacillus neizhouensis TaxID=885475 RepID=A0A3A9K797_9BACI|nr:HPr family phosphocarrier protein [Salipaludibacillus neizhouensis]RKL68417.1 phosphocarrier protein Chr [Salipaludibacillus neizhouensis]